MDVSSVSYDVSRGYSLLFSWTMSWYGESRMAPLTCLVPWCRDGWKSRIPWIWHLEHRHETSPVQHGIEVAGLLWWLRGPRVSIPGNSGGSHKVS